MKVQSELPQSGVGLIPQVVKNFSPAWFASVMGTGIFAIASNCYACYWSWLNHAAVALWIINIVLFLGAFIPWSLRWLLFKDAALRDFKHPVTGQFYATMPIACSVLAADVFLLGPAYLGSTSAVTLTKVLWLIGAALSLLVAVITPLLNYYNNTTAEDLNPAWFMPPVSLIVIPIAGSMLIPYWSPSIQKTMLLLNYASWGMGFFLFLFMAILCFYRFFAVSPLPGPLSPTIWIYLGPIGAGTVSLLKLGAVSSPFLGEMAVPTLNILALIYWSFGLWWFIVAGLITIVHIFQRNLTYSPAWWAFTFPLGAYAVATYFISVNLECEAIRVFGFFAYTLLAFCWSVVFCKTFVRVYNGTLFK